MVASIIGDAIARGTSEPPDAAVPVVVNNTLPARRSARKAPPTLDGPFDELVDDPSAFDELVVAVIVKLIAGRLVRSNNLLSAPPAAPRTVPFAPKYVAVSRPAAVLPMSSSKPSARPRQSGRVMVLFAA